MHFNSKTILSAVLILFCGICVDGHAKSKKHKKKKSTKSQPVHIKADPIQLAPPPQTTSKEVVKQSVGQKEEKEESVVADVAVVENSTPEVIEIEDSVVEVKQEVSSAPEVMEVSNLVTDEGTASEVAKIQLEEVLDENQEDLIETKTSDHLAEANEELADVDLQS